MRHLINTAILLLFATIAANAQNESKTKPNVSAETLALYEPGEFKGVQYRLMKPIDFDPGKTYPLILSLHGGSGRGTQNIKNLLIWNEYLGDADLRRKHPAFVLAPQSNGRWLDNTSEVKLYPKPGSITIDDLPEGMRKFGPQIIERIEEAGRAPEPIYGVLDEVLELIDTQLSKQYKIDVDRVYVLGHSMGGMGTFTAIYQHPDRFAAAIPSAGFFAPWLDVKRFKDVPLWIFHGDADKTVPYSGSRHVFDQLTQLNGNAKLTTLGGKGHGSSYHSFRYKGDNSEKGYITEYASDRCDKTDHIWDWLFNQKRSIQAGRADIKMNSAEAAEAAGSLFDTKEILDESTLDIKILQDWHVDEVTGSTRQKLIEINVAQWWPGQDYRIPVRMIVPLKGKAKGFHITGANPYEGLMKDSRPTAFQEKLLAGDVGIVKTHVKAFRQISGKQSLERKMMRKFMKELNPRYTTLWIWSMTLMRATTAAYAERDHFEKGKVAGSGNSKNGISPAVALINDERFTATCSNHAFAYGSPIRRSEKEEIETVKAANKAFFEAAKAGDVELEAQRARWYQSVMVGSNRNMGSMAVKAEKSMDELHSMRDRLLSSVCVTENWDRLMKRGVDVLFQPGTNDYVAYDILWGAQNHPQLPVYYEPGGGHSQTPHGAAAKDDQNVEAFLWNHFFGGDALLKPPTSSHKVDKDKLSVRVSFDEGPQPTSGRIWWMYDRAPAGSAPFLHVQIPEDQSMDMERDAKTGEWTATLPLKDGYSRIDFFSNHGHMTNGYKQYLSSPYTRVKLGPSPH